MDIGQSLVNNAHVRHFSITSNFAECACAPGAHVHYVLMCCQKFC
jgi:hypothetical protein